MTNLKQNPRQTQSSQQTKQTQVRGFERIIGSIRKAILTTGIRLIVIGIILLVISMLFEIFGQNRQTFKIAEISSDLEPEGQRIEAIFNLRQRILGAASSFCLNVGIALIAAGSVVVTVELKSSEEREEKYETLLAKMDDKTKEILKAIDENTREKIEDLTIASQDTIISSLIQNKNIFNQVKSHILRQDFIVKEYQVTVSLNSHNKHQIEEKTYVKYYIHNISLAKKLYPINFFIYNDKSELNTIPYISRFYVGNKNYFSDQLKAEMRNQRKNAEKHIGFETNIEVEPKKDLKIEIEFIAYRDLNDHEPFLVPQITDTMTLQVITRPQDINVFCIHLHPQEDLCEQPRDMDELEQIWKINTGLFPFQGLYLYWQKSLDFDDANEDAAFIFKRLPEN